MDGQTAPGGAAGIKAGLETIGKTSVRGRAMALVGGSTTALGPEEEALTLHPAALAREPRSTTSATPLVDSVEGTVAKADRASALEAVDNGVETRTRTRARTGTRTRAVDLAVVSVHVGITDMTVGL